MSGRFHVLPLVSFPYLIRHNLKVAISFTFVSAAIRLIWFYLRWVNSLHFIDVDLLGPLIYNHVRLIVINRSSRVCPSIILQSPHVRSSLNFTSIAIWNRNRVVVMTSFSVWGINAAFFIQGTSRHPSSMDH